MQRDVAEGDYSVIQLVSVFIVRFEDRFLTYRRTKRLPEARLHGFYSIGFGGHLNPEDVFGKAGMVSGSPPLLDIFKPGVGEALLQRELSEELRFPTEASPSVEYRGLLYDDSRPVSAQHLGIVYDVHIDTMDYEIGERGFLMDSKFETLDEIHARIEEFENWSLLVVACEMRERGSVGYDEHEGMD
jgi:predicted NUDIX family phosphoesterase